MMSTLRRGRDMIVLGSLVGADGIVCALEHLKSEVLD